MKKYYCDSCQREITGKVNPSTVKFNLRFGPPEESERIYLQGTLNLSLMTPRDSDWCLDCLIRSVRRAVGNETGGGIGHGMSDPHYNQSEKNPCGGSLSECSPEGVKKILATQG